MNVGWFMVQIQWRYASKESGNIVINTACEPDGGSVPLEIRI